MGRLTARDCIEMAADGTGVEIETLGGRKEVHHLRTKGVPTMQDVADFVELLGALAHPLSPEVVWIAQDKTGMTLAFRLVVMPPSLQHN